MSGNHFLQFILILSFFLTGVGCRKEMDTAIEKSNLERFDQIFQSYWDQMNTSYVYWDVDTTNWDKVYKTYQPLFAKLNVNSNADVNTSFRYFESITKGLIDAHYSIDFALNGLSGRSIYPAAARKVSSATFHSPYNYIAIDTGYLEKGFKTGYYITSDHKRLEVISGILHDNVLYFNCNLFSLKEAFTSVKSSTAKEALSYFFNRLHQVNSPFKAVIIDVRNNPGGNIEDLSFVVGRLINKPLNFGFTRYKNGSGRKNYTSWISATIYPDPEGKPLQMPIMILTDHFTISLAEAMAMAVHCLPNAQVIGEQTWGATGPVTNNGIYNAGPFDLKGILSVYTSSAAFKYIDGKIYEGIGFPPDIPVAVNTDSLKNGRDDILNKALAIVK